MYRYITGKIYRTNDEPWRNITATFKRCSGSFTSNIIYPPDSTTCEIDESGNLINCKLWVNESGDKISNYEGKVGTYRFQFSIPVGDGSPIDIGTLIAGSLPVEAYPQSIIDYVDDVIAAVVAGESKSLYSYNFIATQSLSALRIIDLTNLTYASSDNLSQAFVSLGFVNQAVSIGGTFKTITQGLVSDSSWNWQLDKPIFLGINGFLTQTYPNNSLFCKIVASVISTQKIFINFGEPIIL
jgi:hypothetical protein